MPDYVTSVSNRIGPVPFISFPVLPHVFRKEYGLVSCKPLFWYTPKGEAVMMVPWPWIKASHPVRGHGCFRLGPRGGHPLERAYINLIPCYSRLWSPRLKSFSWTMSRVIPSIERYDGCVLVSCVFFRNTVNGTSPSWLRKSVGCGNNFVQTLQSHISLQIIYSMSKFVLSCPNNDSVDDRDSGVSHEC